MSAALQAMRQRWESRRDELRKLGASVNGATLCEEILSDLDALEGDESPVSLQTATQHTGYSVDHLSRLVRSGALANYGRKHAPRVKLSECPIKASLTKRPAYAYNADADARSLVSTRR